MLETDLVLTSKEFYPTIRTVLVSPNTTITAKGRIYIADNNKKCFAKYYFKVKLESGYSNILIFPTLESCETMMHKIKNNKYCGVLYYNVGLIYDSENKNIYA